jgi:hypothetical protein
LKRKSGQTQQLEMKTENQNCYESAEQCLFTRFETGTQGDFLLPYSGLLFARLTSATAEDILTLMYVTHTVTLTGSTLSALLQIIQQGRAETIRAGGGADATTKTPAIRNIIITEGASESESL